MKLSVELVDLIFSFLVSHRRTLLECSKVSELSQIVERHLYHTISVCFRNWPGSDSDPSGPIVLSKFISENPHIPHYVRVLQIRFPLEHRNNDLDIMQDFGNFAKTLLLFPVLECIKLTTPNKRLFSWPDVFRAALEDRLSLPTLKELHIVGNQDFPCSLIDNHENIEDLLVSGNFMYAERHGCVSTEPISPQLKSLALLSMPCHRLFSIIPHISKLQSFKCASSAVRLLPELLGVFSQTLNKLDIDFLYAYRSKHLFQTGGVNHERLPKLSPVPPNLQQLTLRVEIYVEHEPTYCISHLPAAAKVINTFASSVRHLIIEIDIVVVRFLSYLALIDFSPLAVLGAASLSIPRIDLYIHTDTLPPAVILTQLLSSLAGYNDVMKLIEDGKLVIHPGVTAPDYVRVQGESNSFALPDIEGGEMIG